MLTIRHSVDVEGPELKTLDGLAYVLEIRQEVGAPADAMFGASPGQLSIVWREDLELVEEGEATDQCGDECWCQPAA